MKNFFKIFFGVLFLAIVFSCVRYQSADEQVNSIWQGQYNGNFSGDQIGTVSFVVSKTGGIDGTLKRTGYSDDEFGGYVSANGKFDFNSRANFFFSGFLDNVMGSNGHWYNSTGDKGSYLIKIK